MSYSYSLRENELVTGVFASIQTFGEWINFARTRIPRLDNLRLAEVFAREVLDLLASKELLSPELAEQIQSSFNKNGPDIM